MLRVDLRLLKLLVVVRLDLLIKSFFHFFLYAVLFHLLVSCPLVFHHSFLHGRLFDQVMLKLHVLEPFLFIQLLIILVNFLVLAEVFVQIRSLVKEIVLILQIFHLCLLFLPKFVLSFLVFLSDLLVQRIQDCALHALAVSSSLFFGFVADLQVISTVIVLHTRVFSHFKEPCIFLLSLLSLDDFLVFLSFLFFLQVIGLLGDKFVVPAVGLFFLLVHIVFGTELTIKLASKGDKKSAYLKFNFFYMAKSFYFSLSLSYSRALYWLIRAHYYFWGEIYGGE